MHLLQEPLAMLAAKRLSGVCYIVNAMAENFVVQETWTGLAFYDRYFQDWLSTSTRRFKLKKTQPNCRIVKVLVFTWSPHTTHRSLHQKHHSFCNLARPEVFGSNAYCSGTCLKPPPFPPVPRSPYLKLRSCQKPKSGNFRKLPHMF